MINRDIYNNLNVWKKNPGRKPLLIRGARQVGKSYIVQVFGENEFKNLVVINFERDPQYKEIFKSNHPTEILEKLTILTNQNIIQGETLLFLDEIQECPEAIISLRYFYEELPQLHIVGAGSLLEFALNLKTMKMPVGRVQYMYMKPIGFYEFMNALGENKLLEYIQNHDLSSVPDIIHKKLIDLVKKYFIIGGMPQVVQEYISSKDILKCQQIQRSIIDTYEDDFSKYSKKANIGLLKKVFNSATTFIGQKFVYSTIDPNYKIRDIKNAVELLETAGVLIKVRKSNGEGLPLEANVNDRYFKILFLDIGLVHNIRGGYHQTILEENIASVFKGALAEQFVGQELLVNQDTLTRAKLYYWIREAKNSNAKVDYLIAIKNQVVPIEVKYGKTNKMNSLRMFIEKYNSKIAFKISQDKYAKKDKINFIPYYAIPRILK